MTTRTTMVVLYSALTVCGLGGCGSAKDPAPDTMTQRQRDSAIGASGLPGARGVQQATRASDSARARAARVDSTEP